MALLFANSVDPDQMPHLRHLICRICGIWSGSLLFANYPFRGLRTTTSCTNLCFFILLFIGIATLLESVSNGRRHRNLRHADVYQQSYCMQSKDQTFWFYLKPLIHMKKIQRWMMLRGFWTSCKSSNQQVKRNSTQKISDIKIHACH